MICPDCNGWAYTTADGHCPTCNGEGELPDNNFPSGKEVDQEASDTEPEIATFEPEPSAFEPELDADWWNKNPEEDNNDDEA